MAVSWLLKGKTLPPKQMAGVQPRHKLLEGLMLSPPPRITIVEAPAGFGKTTLLALWRTRLIAGGVRVAWLTLDRDDVGDILTAYLAFALSEAGVDMTAAGLSTQGPISGKSDAIQLNAVLNAVGDADEQVCLILDDVEKMSEPEALRQIEKIIRYAPANLQIALAFRTNPGLTLADASVKGLVHRVDDAILRFSSEEARAYLGDIIPSHQMTAVTDRTEGWPVALQMLRALAQQRRSAGAKITHTDAFGHLTAHYIGEQLFESLAPYQQAFLLDIGLLEEVSIALVEHVRGTNDARRLFEELGHLSALIVPLEGAEDLFRIHPLFREYLCTVASYDPARASLIHRRAAEWLADRDSLPAALHHAMIAGDRTLAASLIERAGAVSIWIRSGMAKVAAANRIVDQAMIAQYPRLGLMRCIVLMKQSKMRDARACYEHVATITQAFTRDRIGGDEGALLRDSLFVRSMLALYGCMPLADDHLLAIERDMHDPSTDHMVMAHHKTVLCVTQLQSGRLDAAWRVGREATEHCLAFDSLYGATFIDFHLGSAAMAQGDAQEATHRYEKAVRAIRRHFSHDAGMRLIIDVLTAELQLERNDVAGARHALMRVVERLHGAEAWYDIYAAAYGAAVDLYFSERGASEALALIDYADRHVEHQGLGKLQTILEALRVNVLTLSGDLKQALRVVERSPAAFSTVGLMDDKLPSWREVEAVAMALVRLKTAAGRHEDAERTALKARSYAQEFGIVRMLLRLDVLRLRNAQAAGEAVKADDIARDVLRATARTGYFRPLLREGVGILPVFNRAKFDAGPELETLKEIERRLEDESSARLAPIFSRREMDVLLHLNGGLQDKIIARRLGITEHTVRFHLKNIYAKTRSQGRLDAVTKARALGLLG